jgi:hypothetical protein
MNDAVLTDFAALYTLLSGDMVSVDCGIRCGKFCCDPDNTTKYLLPGEEDHLRAAGVGGTIRFVDHFYFQGYRATPGGAGEQAGCACTTMRGHRPFCCRVFPFRPRLQDGVVVGVQKAKGEQFAPCWIEEPLTEWAAAATRAWATVLADRDNLLFYARLALLWEMARAQDAAGGPATLARIAALHELPERRLLDDAKRFFDRT